MGFGKLGFMVALALQTSCVSTEHASLRTKSGCVQADPVVSNSSARAPSAFVSAGWEVLAEYDNGAVPTNPTRTFVYGSYIDEPLMMDKAGQKYYYACNALYSVAALTDGAGNVVERYKYEPYGMVTVLDADGIVKTTGFVGNPYTFTGQRLDGETGLMYYKNRYYDVDLGRFVGRDPLSSIDTTTYVELKSQYLNLKLYSYVSNRPTILFDPLGLFDFKACLARWRPILGDRADRHCLWEYYEEVGGYNPIEDYESYKLPEVAQTPTKPKPKPEPPPRYRYTPETASGEGGELVVAGGFGYAVVNCCNMKNQKIRAWFVKTCIGPIVSANFYSKHILSDGMNGIRCPEGYAGWFFEYGASLGPIGFGGESSRDVSGFGVGLGWTLFKLGFMWCYYDYIDQDVVGCCDGSD